jgi:hypothetical protein
MGLDTEEFRVTGVLMAYQVLCTRKAWLFAHRHQTLTRTSTGAIRRGFASKFIQKEGQRGATARLWDHRFYASLPKGADHRARSAYAGKPGLPSAGGSMKSLRTKHWNGWRQQTWLTRLPSASLRLPLLKGGSNETVRYQTKDPFEWRTVLALYSAQ